ncbi:MAG: hypothetical protein IV298_15420 [Cylindrospermopsis raciborskii KL1]|uniref:hypothetical protein n=1 Tax=Cylindrospermopsis raciborskii TaxID=77022 RepID=UPI001A1B9B1C|nr:hypothetical protein [Cylindrospermopsis raciborskii]MBG0744828.1 hypothetical protein [Cylindrospermopsis raciborskii KL1]
MDIPLPLRSQGKFIKVIECDLAWRVLCKHTSPFLLKGKFEGGKQAIAFPWSSQGSKYGR